jgi:hypothetical protein
VERWSRPPLTLMIVKATARSVRRQQGCLAVQQTSERFDLQIVLWKERSHNGDQNGHWVVQVLGVSWAWFDAWVRGPAVGGRIVRTSGTEPSTRGPAESLPLRELDEPADVSLGETAQVNYHEATRSSDCCRSACWCRLGIRGGPDIAR